MKAKVSATEQAEILHEYEQAKHPRAQIGKLADLHGICKEDVLEILGLDSANDAPTMNDRYYPKPIGKRPVDKWTKEELERLEALRDEGKSALESAEALGRSISSVKNKLYYLSHAPGKVKVTGVPVEEKQQPSQEDSSAMPQNDGEKSGTCKGCNNEPANLTNVSCSMCERYPGPIYCEHPTDMWEAPAASTERSGVQAEQDDPAAEAVSESVPESREVLKEWLEPDGIMSVVTQETEPEMPVGGPAMVVELPEEAEIAVKGKPEKPGWAEDELWEPFEQLKQHRLNLEEIDRQEMRELRRLWEREGITCEKPMSQWVAELLGLYRANYADRALAVNALRRVQCEMASVDGGTLYYIAGIVDMALEALETAR